MVAAKFPDFRETAARLMFVNTAANAY